MALPHFSAIPGTIDDLITVFGTAAPTDTNNEPIMVWFGAELGVFTSPTTIEINGVDPVTREWAVLGPDYTIEEHFSVKCKISVFSGLATSLQDFIATKNLVFGVWNALEMAVANNPTLDGNVRLAWFDECMYEPSQDAAGQACGEITWVVKCEARVSTLS